MTRKSRNFKFILKHHFSSLFAQNFIVHKCNTLRLNQERNGIDFNLEVSHFPLELNESYRLVITVLIQSSHSHEIQNTIFSENHCSSGKFSAAMDIYYMVTVKTSKKRFIIEKRFKYD